MVNSQNIERKVIVSDPNDAFLFSSIIIGRAFWMLQG